LRNVRALAGDNNCIHQGMVFIRSHLHTMPGGKTLRQPRERYEFGGLQADQLAYGTKDD
jgi:hypothetical protein